MQQIKIDPQGASYYVDIVFCIDATGSMQPIIDQVKANAKKMPEEIMAKSEEKGKKIKQLRLKLIEYRDLVEDQTGQMVEYDFTTDANVFKSQVDKIVADGGGDYPESTFDAILRACESDWYNGQGKKRKIIIVMTDDKPREIHPSSLKEGESPTVTTVINRYLGMSESNEGRLLIIAPECEEYSLLAQAEFTEYIKASPGKGLADIGFYDIVIPWIVNSI